MYKFLPLKVQDLIRNRSGSFCVFVNFQCILSCVFFSFFLFELAHLAMAGSLMRYGFCISGSNEIKAKRNIIFYPSTGSQRFTQLKTRTNDWRLKSSANFSVHAHASLCVRKAMRWWDKTLQPNMIEIKSAQELVDSLLNADDKLVIIDFYAPGCGGCRTLHPKICQIAESNPNAIILKVNYEELKTLCTSLNVHVLPFFRFYRGAEGRLCSFSCTNATIKKFKDALAKHGSERCCIGLAKGLEDSELLKLASNKEIPLQFPLRTRDTMEYEFLTTIKTLDSSSMNGNRNR